jgi:septal ring factor EnvC (AmiA/AmiB activator)
MTDQTWHTSELTLHLKRFRHRLRLRHGWQLAQRTLWIAALAALLVQLVGRLFPIPQLWLWSLLPLPIWLLVIVVYAAFRPWPLMRIARHVDGELGLRERLSTALALQGQNVSPGGASEWRMLALSQRQDALGVAASIVPALAFPLKWLLRPLALAGVILALALAAPFLPNPMNDVLAERAAIRQEAQKQAEKIDQARRQIEQNQELSPAQREVLLRQLQQLAEQLRANPGDLERAIADLSNLEKLLQARADPNAAAQQAGLQRLAEELAKMSHKRSDTAASAEQSAAEAAAAALQALADQFDQLTPEERQQIAAQLAQQAALAAQSGDAGLAQALSALAQAFSQAAQSGDPQAISEAAQSAQNAVAQAISEATTRLNDQAALAQALAQVQNSRRAMAQAGQAISEATQSGQPGQAQPGSQASTQPGQGQPGQGQPGQGQSPGQGNSSSPGQPGGGGANVNTLPPSTSTGLPGRPQGNAPNPAASGLPPAEAAPWQRSPSNGDQIFIPGQDSSQGTTQTNPISEATQSNLPGVNNPALVPYTQSYYTYLNAANQALQSGHIPQALSAYVRDYFTQIAPPVSEATP